jgi:hypothetical protein
MHVLSNFLMAYLVRLHRFQQSEAADVDDTNLMSHAGAGIQVHQRHDVLRELSIWRVSSDVHNLCGGEEEWEETKRFA